MRSSSKVAFGIVLIAGSVLALVIAFAQVVPFYAGHFSNLCGAVENQGTSDSRMVYCISAWPLQPSEEYCCSGVSDVDQITIRELSLRREAETLLVDDQPVPPGEVYNSFRWRPSINPWLFLTIRFTLKNEGLNSTSFSSSGTEVLYVTGDISGRWFVNPLGLIILGSGIWLFRQGRKEQG